MKGGSHDELAKELQVTSVSSLGSASSQYQTSLSSLDKNGDGIISADELAAANTGSTKPSTSSSGDDGTGIAQKIAADIVSIMLQMQASARDDARDDTGDNAGDDGAGGSKGIFASLDANGDGRLTADELLSADPSSVAGTASSADDPVLTQVLNDMQTAIRAYQTTYGASPVAATADDVQSV
jgi:Ca2+-binding EF-hand superfamily protein